MKNKLLFTLSVLFILSSCSKEGFEVERIHYDNYEAISSKLNLPENPLSYDIEFPSYYSRSGFGSGGGNVVTTFDNNAATLGRVLFYDTNLSDDRTVSCASCHKQELAFADDVAFSKGVNNQVTARNSLALGSVFSFREYYGSISIGLVPFFWDNRASSVQEQSEQTLANPTEMNIKMDQVLARVKEQSYYPPLFKAAFGDREIYESDVLFAIGEFVNSMGTYDSKYDDELARYYDAGGDLTDMLGRDLPGLSAVENSGKDIYLSNCASCHGATNGLPGEIAANNGLDAVSTDLGMGVLDPSMKGMFKVPTLRNITLTAPYMHDGRFATLSDVIDHYSAGVQDHPNLGASLKDNFGNPKQLNFSDQEKSDLIAFFKTFEDDTFINSQKYADPFKK